MKKTQIRNEFNKIKKQNSFLKEYKLVFDFGLVQELNQRVVGQHCPIEKQISLNELELDRSDILDILIHEVAHAWVSWYNKNYYNKITNQHGIEWYNKYVEMGGEGGEEYRLRFQNEGLSIKNGVVQIG